MIKKLTAIFISILFISVPLMAQSSIVIGSNTEINAGTNTDICATSKTVDGTLSGSGTWCTGPLPVELTFFTASVSGSSVQLLWSTATESQNYGFDIERRLVLEASWQSIGFIPGSGNSNSLKSYTYTDNAIPSGSYQYRLKQIDTDGSFQYSGFVEVLIGTPTDFALSQNYPNPFNPSTTINFDVPLQSEVTLTLFNALGEVVKELVKGACEPGRHEVSVNTTNLPSGVYIYRLQAGGFMQTKKMVLIR